MKNHGVILMLSFICVILLMSVSGGYFQKQDLQAKVDLLEMQIENIRQAEEADAFLQCTEEDRWIPMQHFPELSVACPGYEND